MEREILRLRIPSGEARLARIGLSILLIVGGIAGLLGLMLILYGLLVHTEKFLDVMGATALGILLLGFFVGVLVFRSKWYRTRGIFVSWPCFLEAVSAAIGRPPFSRDELDALLKYAAERQDPTEPIANLYHVAYRRRRDDPEAELEFIWLANVLYKYVSNVHQVSQHTILKEYAPARYRIGAVFGWVWVAVGICGAITGLLVPGLSPAVRTIIAAGGGWGLSIGVGLTRRWHWALLQGLLFLVAVETVSFYLIVTRKSDEPSGFLLLGVYVPVFLALYLYRRRAWFSGRDHR